jgi:simple sugar transport system permease protein
VIIGSLLFGLSLSLATALQLAGITIPIDIVTMLPYVAVMAALILFARRSYLPPALALPYSRGGR